MLTLEQFLVRNSKARSIIFPFPAHMFTSASAAPTHAPTRRAGTYNMCCFFPETLQAEWASVNRTCKTETYFLVKEEKTFMYI